MRKSGIWLILGLFCLVISLASWKRQAQDVSGDVGITVEKEKYIALTFDDGPNPQTTAQLLDGLKERDAHASFFVVGELAASNEDLLVRMQREGHQVGNHTYAHIQLDEESLTAALTDLEKNDTLLRGILDEGCYWIRPPWGMITEELKAAIDVPMVYWSVDTEDWLLLDADKVLKKAVQETENGDIVLMHDIYPTTVEAALCFVDIMQAQGYEFVTVEELLEINDVSVTTGVMYRTGDGQIHMY